MYLSIIAEQHFHVIKQIPNVCTIFQSVINIITLTFAMDQKKYNLWHIIYSEHEKH